MGIISQREVREHSIFFKVTVVLSLVTVIAAIILYNAMPSIMSYKEKRLAEKDIRSIERVYSVMQQYINEDYSGNIPSAMWDVSLEDLGKMSTTKEFHDELCRRLNVSSLKDLEGEGFDSGAYKGSRYIIYMYDGSKELHLTVHSNIPDEYEDVVY